MTQAPPSTVRARVRRVRYEPEPGAPTAGPPLPAGPMPPTAGPDGVHEFAEVYHDLARILRIALEVLDHRRPLLQLDGHFAAAPLRCWRVATMRRRPRTPAELRRMRMCIPRPGVAEVAVAADVDGRVRALAARFERAHTGWRCTDVRLG
ncbi:hypothetical protein BJF78_15975 [Pseudonocardia sp. CNS-139]|nr:hypothetical protein BJF78_15975 [Pseudonocardia sp. CNS-139]